MESWSLNPTELNWDYCCTSSTRSSCEIRLDSDKTEKCLTNSKPHDEQQSCNGICIDSNDIICPDNPGYCVNANRACDGRKENACECSAPFKNSPFYEPPDACISDRKYCGEREGAKFQNRQCYRPDDNHEYYQCLNRKDIGEDVLRTKPTFDSEKQVSNRKNYFQLLANSNITNNSITCDDESLEINCLDPNHTATMNTISASTARILVKMSYEPSQSLIQKNKFQTERTTFNCSQTPTSLSLTTASLVAMKL